MSTGLSLVLALAVSSAPAADKDSERVVTKAAVYLAKEPSFLSPRASPTPLTRGQKVKVEGEQKGAWFLVRPLKRGTKKVQGYLHVSSLSDREVAFRAEEKDVKGGVKVSGNYNLAVPGFSEEVAERREKATKKETEKGYRLVNQFMPQKPGKQSVLGEPHVLLAFGTEGRLREPGTDVVLGAPPPTPEPAADPEPEPGVASGESPAAVQGATSPAEAAASNDEKRPAPAPVAAPAPAARSGKAGAAAPAAGVKGAPTGPASDPSEWGGP